MESIEGIEAIEPVPGPVPALLPGFATVPVSRTREPKRRQRLWCVGKKKHLGGRLIATRHSTPCGACAPLSDVAEIHTDKMREQSLHLLEECHRQDTEAIFRAPLRLVGWLVG